MVTLYAVAWMVITTYRGSIVAIPMPTMEICKTQAVEWNGKIEFHDEGYAACLTGGT